MQKSPFGLEQNIGDQKSADDKEQIHTIISGSNLMTDGICKMFYEHKNNGNKAKPINFIEIFQNSSSRNFIALAFCRCSTRRAKAQHPFSTYH